MEPTTNTMTVTGALASYTVTLYSPDRARVASVEDVKVNGMTHRVNADVTYQPERAYEDDRGTRTPNPAHVSLDYGYRPIARLTTIDTQGTTRETDATPNAIKKIAADISAAVLPIFQANVRAGMIAALERAADRAAHELIAVNDELAKLQERARALTSFATNHRALATNIADPELCPTVPDLDTYKRAAWAVVEDYKALRTSEAHAEAALFGWRADDGMSKEYLAPMRAVKNALAELNPPTADADTADADELEAAAAILSNR